MKALLFERSIGCATGPLLINEEAQDMEDFTYHRPVLATETIEAKRLEFEGEVRAAGKPEALVAKIVAGKMEAYFGRVVLLDQNWVREPKVRIADLINEVGAKTGENIQVRRFARFHMGIA